MSGYPQLPKIPDIEIERELGAGTHSVVYRGRHRGQPCAVKLPRVKARWTQWIYREAVALARVSHPLLPRVLEVNAIDDLPYLVMELVEGDTLADVLDAVRSLDEARTIDLGRQLASVLEAVHGAGLVHRDVKPRNIVIERGTGALKLVDFGFATPMERVGAGHDRAGTAAYAAPEQLEPPGHVDARSDLFAVGRVLFECLSGVSAVESSALSAVRARQHLLERGVTIDLADIVASLLSNDPNGRYSNAQSLALDLARVQAKEAIRGPSHKEDRWDVTMGRSIARSAELERVTKICRDVGEHGVIVFVRGPRGSGKSHLLTALAHRVRPSGVCVHVRCQQDDPPLSTLRRIIEAFCEDIDATGAVPRPLRVTTEDLRFAVSNLAPVATLIAGRRLAQLDIVLSASTTPLTGVAGAAESLAEGAAEILLRLAMRAPGVVLIVDDAQWMDPASADALTRAACQLSATPLVMVFGLRPASASVYDRFGELRPKYTHSFDLGRLDDQTIIQLIAEYLGLPDVDVNGGLASRVAAMSAGTPLGVYEVLGAFLDAGAVRPQAGKWLFDSDRTDRATLPRGTVALLGRRVGELAGSTRRILQTAAFVGTTFDAHVIAKALSMTKDDLDYGLASARRAGLLELDRGGADVHRFIHNSLRELLMEELPATEQRTIHSDIAAALDTRSDNTSFEELCALAHHYANGHRERDLRRVMEVTRLAGDAALARFDNETALRFLQWSREAADSAGCALDSGHFRSVGEAELRLGSLDASVAAFEAALSRATTNEDRALLFGRLAWVLDAKAEPERAWKALEQAFRAMDSEMPVEDIRSAAKTSARLARFGMGKLLDRKGAVELTERTIDQLCTLHYQNARLGIEYGRPARVVQSSLESVALASGGGGTATRARAEVWNAMVMTTAGMKDVAAKSLDRAFALAGTEGDLLTTAFCAQMRAMVVSWSGDFDKALHLMRECIDLYGPWYELNEYALITSSAETINTLRGRAHESWQWMDRTLQRLKRSRVRPKTTDFIIQRARAALATLNRDARGDVWLARALAAVSPDDPGVGYHRLASWGPRARYFLETNNFTALESLMTQFEAEGHEPKSVHIGVSEYYVVVAHARIHQCLTAQRVAIESRPDVAPDRSGSRPEMQLRNHLERLRKAASDLKTCGRIPILKAHALVAFGTLAWAEGNEKKANALLADAEESARNHDCPWVQFAVARTRAHMLRAIGRERAALDHARIAETLARESGAATRQRWILEDFALNEYSTRRSSRTPLPSAFPKPRHVSSSSSSGTNRQLTTLLHVVRAPRRDLRTEQQAAAILDELINALHAERAAIAFRPESNAQVTAVSRHRASESSVSIQDDSPRGRLLKHVQATGEQWPQLTQTPLGDLSVPVGDLPTGLELDADRILAVPLFLYEKPVGALCIERGVSDPVFGLDDRSLLEILSHQVPIALEIARLLFEREQLHTSLQQAKKMEAMGQLAGGLAHDFNNMLAAMKVSLNAAQERATDDEELTTELEIIADAMQRAAQLTGQLLSFSRHQPVPTALHDVTELVLRLEPMMRRVAGNGVNVVVKTAPNVGMIEVDQSSFDQALVNLLINARDAMPAGGTFTITTKAVTVEGNEAQRLSVAPGDFVEIEVTDTGEGMSAETMTRIFEPFFTTKAAGRGTGLGLATVYAFARNAGGGIEVSSEPGKGTQFRVLLKRVSRARSSHPVKLAPNPDFSSDPNKTGPDTILVVDDDDLVRRSIAKILERNGYRVIAASGSTEALDVARQHGSRIALIILDVLMPGLTGPELGRRLYDLKLPAKMLFVSGFSPESIQIEEAQVAADSLLQKPFSQAVLLERVRSLMHS